MARPVRFRLVFSAVTAICCQFSSEVIAENNSWVWCRYLLKEATISGGRAEKIEFNKNRFSFKLTYMDGGAGPQKEPFKGSIRNGIAKGQLMPINSDGGFIALRGESIQNEFAQLLSLSSQDGMEAIVIKNVVRLNSVDHVQIACAKTFF